MNNLNMFNLIKTNISVFFLKQQVRTFACSSRQRQDIIQEIYLRALKSCKPYTIKPTNIEDYVMSWKLPDPPKAPEIDLDVAADLDAYEKEVVTEMSSPMDTEDPLNTLFEEKEEVHH
ncbi:hypothetical protein PORY_002019 [Pneumocystis oryctolagi]|uniref:Uncharacterized protein n=1 Tax=Pneumocystis oryctolagi TaxID=42067 RepID=A0ACB7CAK8_9ASCO|nr:hypothetical protein PORY_002019 [Pneumocystis oryctolagi]